MLKFCLLSLAMVSWNALAQTNAELAADISLMKKIISLQQDKIKTLEGQKFYHKTKKETTPALYNFSAHHYNFGGSSNWESVSYDVPGLTFTNLQVGKLYQYTFFMECTISGTSSTAASLRWEVRDERAGANPLFKGDTTWQGNTSIRLTHASGTVIFKAEATKVFLRLRPQFHITGYTNPGYPLEGNTYYYPGSGFATLTELPGNYVNADEAQPAKGW